jgi:hypothetical protein
VSGRLSSGPEKTGLFVVIAKSRVSAWLSIIGGSADNRLRKRGQSSAAVSALLPTIASR